VSDASLQAAHVSDGREGRLGAAAVAPLVLGVVLVAVATLPAGRAAVAATAATALVIASVSDIRWGLIPNRIVLPASALVMALQLILFPQRASEWALAAVVVALAFALPEILGRAWVGMGDVKLAFLLGAALGWEALAAVALGFICAFPLALAVLVRGGMAARAKTIPLGPFLSLGGLIVLFAPHIVGLSSV